MNNMKFETLNKKLLDKFMNDKAKRKKKKTKSKKSDKNLKDGSKISQKMTETDNNDQFAYSRSIVRKLFNLIFLQRSNDFHEYKLEDSKKTDEIFEPIK